MSTDLERIWNLTMAEIEKNLSRPSFETWLKSTKPLSLRDKTVLVEVPNDFTRDWLEKRYKDLILNALYVVTNINYELCFTISPQEIDLEQEMSTLSSSVYYNGSSINDESRLSPYQPPSLNPRYTFQSFVIGNCNRLSHAASLAVAEAPSEAYNPLFIYGGVGLGKTHLLHAIAHHILQKHDLKQIFYISTEKFTNEFINAIRDNRTLEFRNKYRNGEILLIDDIQFLAGKEQTQEEFFHTFNTLHESYRQIVISSDRPPKEIPTLEDRLRSRFEWGLITDIQPPDLETREAILRKKATSENIEIPNDVIRYIAGKIDTNIRELEGALIRIVAYASLTGSPINLQLADESLKKLLLTKKQNVTVAQIMSKTAAHFNITREDMKAKRRHFAVTFPRQVAMFLCRQLTELSLPKIGSEFGGRDHTTVLHACKKISHELSSNENLRHKIEVIKNDLLS